MHSIASTSIGGDRSITCIYGRYKFFTFAIGMLLSLFFWFLP